jgi:predicted amidohydrolase YtcJ
MTIANITDTTRRLIEDLYKGNPSKDVDDVWLTYHKAQGMMILWSKICFDMGASPGINIAQQEELESLITKLDDVDRQRLGMPRVHCIGDVSLSCGPRSGE